MRWVIDLMLDVMRKNKLRVNNKCEDHYVHWLKIGKT